MSRKLAFAKAFGTVPAGINAELLSVLESVYVTAGAAGLYQSDRLTSKPSILSHLNLIHDGLKSTIKADKPSQMDMPVRMYNILAYTPLMQPSLQNWIVVSAAHMLAAVTTSVEAQQARDEQVNAGKAGVSTHTQVALVATAAVACKAALCHNDGHRWPAAFFTGYAALHLAAAAASHAHSRRPTAHLMASARNKLLKEHAKLGQLLQQLLDTEVLQPFESMVRAIFTPADPCVVASEVAAQLREHRRRAMAGVTTLKRVLSLLSTGSFYSFEPSWARGATRWARRALIAERLARGGVLGAAVVLAATNGVHADALTQALRWWWASDALRGRAAPAWVGLPLLLGYLPKWVQVPFVPEQAPRWAQKVVTMVQAAYGT